LTRRLIKILIALALWAPIGVIAAGYAQSLNAEDFSGYDMKAKASAISFIFDSPSLGIPAHPTGELNFAYSEASLQSGPAAYGLGSILWPGQVAAALPPFLQDTIEDSSGGQFEFPVDVPAWPIRAESFYPQGPTDSSLDSGTMHMRSSAKEKSAEGVSYLNKFVLPAIASMGNQASFSTLGFDPDGAVSMTEAAANGVSLLNGAITFDSVVTRATARSNGEKGSVAGTTTIVGAEVGGTPVAIDSNGVHVAGSNTPTAAQQQALNQVLNQLGVTMELSRPVDTVNGASASRALGGLVISIKSSTVEPLISALPADLQTQIRGQITFDQTFAVQIAPAAVSAAAAKVIEFEPPAVVPPAGPATSTDDNSSTSSDEPLTPVGEDVSGDTSGDTGGAGVPTTGGAPTAIALQPVKTDFGGVPVWLTVLLVLIALVSSRPLTMLADRIFAARAASGCPEGRD
jgi:hypothetical protein